MTITDRQVKGVKEIILDGAKLNFPASVKFEDATVTVMINGEEEEFLNVELLYTAPVLDGRLMNTLFQVIDEPMRAAGITAHALVHYIYVHDPTRKKSPKTQPPAP